MRPRPVPGPSPAPVPGPRRRAGAVDTPWQDTSPLCGRPTADLGSILPHARDETTAAAAATTTARPTPQSRLQGLRRGPEGTRPAPPPEAQNFFLIPPYAGARGGLSCWQSSHYRNTMTDTELATHVGQRSDDRTIGQIGRSDEAHRTHGQSRLDVANGIQPMRPIRPVWPTSSLKRRLAAQPGNYPRTCNGAREARLGTARRKNRPQPEGLQSNIMMSNGVVAAPGPPLGKGPGRTQQCIPRRPLPQGSSVSLGLLLARPLLESNAASSRTLKPR